MIEALQFEFMQHALLAGLLVSFAAGIIGSLIVVNRMVFLAGGIAHTSYGGIGLAVYFGLPIFLEKTSPYGHIHRTYLGCWYGHRCNIC